MAPFPEPEPPFGAALTRRLILSSLAMADGEGEGHGGPVRISADAVALAAELLRLFVAEAQHRAGILAECEQEAAVAPDADGAEAGATTAVRIDAHHITQIAAELLMDFT